jgi:hypothetical protein
MAIKVNYKMSKQDKISLARIIDPHERGEQRRLIVEADLHMMSAPKRNPLEKDRNTNKNTKSE